jgi:hypothetical protein
MNKQKQIEKMKKILKENGIEMKVGGCGCCGSPWVTFTYKGKKIIDVDDCVFDTQEIVTDERD